jgi:hypothetical protein
MEWKHGTGVRKKKTSVTSGKIFGNPRVLGGLLPLFMTPLRAGETGTLYEPKEKLGYGTTIPLTGGTHL